MEPLEPRIVQVIPAPAGLLCNKERVICLALCEIGEPSPALGGMREREIRMVTDNGDYLDWEDGHTVITWEDGYFPPEA